MPDAGPSRYLRQMTLPMLLPLILLLWQELLESCLDFSYPVFNAYVDKVSQPPLCTLRGGDALVMIYT
jgi:hypothetical protein